jgi:hypothetical protein
MLIKFRTLSSPQSGEHDILTALDPPLTDFRALTATHDRDQWVHIYKSFD